MLAQVDILFSRYDVRVEVVVLPSVPVTPISLSLLYGFSYNRLRILINSFSKLSTTITGTVVLLIGLFEIMATAPLLIASIINSFSKSYIILYKAVF